MTQLALPARITLAEAIAVASELGAKAAASANGAAGLVFDASAVQAFDSSAFAVMLDVMRQVPGAGSRADVRGAPASMAALAKLYGVDELLSFSSLHPT